MPLLILSIICMGVFILNNTVDINVMVSGYRMFDFFFSWGYFESNSLGAYSVYYTVLNNAKLLFWSMLGLYTTIYIVFKVAKKYKERVSMNEKH